MKKLLISAVAAAAFLAAPLSTPRAEDKMADRGDKMAADHGKGDKMDGKEKKKAKKMKGDKMKGDKMHDGKMDDGKMKDGKM